MNTYVYSKCGPFVFQWLCHSGPFWRAAPSNSGHAHAHLSVGEDVFVEKEADPCQGEALRLVDGQRIGEADGELGAFLGERTALDRASVQHDEDFPRAGSTLTE